MFLSLQNVISGYGKKKVLDGVTFSIKQNDLVLLTGGNGSGKSTVLKCIFGLLPLWGQAGSIIFQGDVLEHLEPFSLVKKGMAFVPQKNNFFDSLTVEEHLKASGSLYSKSVVSERLDSVLATIGLAGFRNRTPFSFSGGERQLVAIGTALMHDPEFLMLDEPFAGLDHKNSEKILSLLLQLQESGKTLLVVEHKKLLNTCADKHFHMYLGKITQTHSKS